MTYPKPQKALVAVGVMGRAIFLAIDGDDLEFEVGEVGNFVEDFLDKVPEESGLYVWEGQVDKVNTSCWDEPPLMGLEYTGKFRPIFPVWSPKSFLSSRDPLKTPVDLGIDQGDDKR